MTYRTWFLLSVPRTLPARACDPLARSLWKHRLPPSRLQLGWLPWRLGLVRPPTDTTPTRYHHRSTGCSCRCPCISAPLAGTTALRRYSGLRHSATRSSVGLSHRRRRALVLLAKVRRASYGGIEREGYGGSIRVGYVARNDLAVRGVGDGDVRVEPQVVDDRPCGGCCGLREEEVRRA